MRHRNADAETVRAIARMVAAFDTGALDEHVLAQAKLLLIDAIGCALMAGDDPVAAAARAIVAPDPRPGCPLIGHRQRTDVLGAVLANGVAVRVADLNDYVVGEQDGQPESAGHPSDNIPVAMAMASARRRSGREMLAAIVIGYELYVRMQNLMDRGGPWDRTTASGLVAAAMAGRLMGLDAERLAHAMALGLARAATPALARSGDMSAAKAVANAMVAQSAVEAALLAERGVTGPLAILDAEKGLAALFAGGERPRLSAAFPEDGGAIMHARIKAYPCVNTGQSAVAAALALSEQLGSRARSLKQIELTMADYPAVKRHQDDPARLRPTSRESADHSFPFLVAVALIDGEFGIRQFEGERWCDPAITELMGRITMLRDASLNARALGTYPCVLRASDHTGQEFAVEILHPPGFSQAGLDESVVLAKFHRLAASGYDSALRDRIVEAAMSLDRAPSAAALDSAIAIERSYS